MSFHDIRETTTITTVGSTDQTSALLKEYMATAVAGIKGASLSDRSSFSNLGKDGTMLLGLAPLTDLLESAKAIENAAQREQTNNRQSRALESGDAAPNRSTLEKMANKLNATSDASHARTHENSAATSSGALSAISEAIAKSVLSEVSPSGVARGAISAAIDAYLQETAPKHIAPPPRPK